ncbi:MAG: hypothetical protein ACOYMF_15740 [Bacteroidales bacterium]
MKKLIISFAIMMAGINLTNAQTLIAVHNESNATFYSILDSAITHALDGDYIYLPGGSFKINVPINKQLQIVGVGHNPDSCAATGITQVTGNFVINNGSDHGSITGLKIYGDISFALSTGQSIDYFSIERCNMGNVTLTTHLSNILINECVIRGAVNGGGGQGLLLTKCILEGGVSGFVANTYVNNNIFLTGISIPSTGCFLKNNIFLGSGPTPNAGSTDLYQNNSFTTAVSNLYNCHNNIVTPLTGLFVNKTKSVFDYDQDYHILETSPAHLAGTDGTDLGIYGTGSPWKEGSVPGNPHIQFKSFSTVNGNLNVLNKVAAQD